LGIQQILSSNFVFFFHNHLLQSPPSPLGEELQCHTNLRLIVKNNVFFNSSPIGTKAISQCLEGIWKTNEFLLSKFQNNGMGANVHSKMCYLCIWFHKKTINVFTIKDEKEPKKVKEKLENTPNFLPHEDNFQVEVVFHLASF
jgi:hypothetical protein